MATRSLVLGLGLAALAALAACIQDDGSHFNPLRGFTEVSEDDERELGMQFDRELQKHVTVMHDPMLAGFLNDLGQSIVRQIEPQPYIYRFRVIRDESLNAFAVPGGYIYFHSGTVLAASNIDELAGVMGHEIAHVKARHFARMKKQSQLPDLLAGLAGMAGAVATGEPGVLVATQAANVALKLRFSREFEVEADQLGGIFMVRAGYDPEGMSRFFERILAVEKRHPNHVPPYLYSHPDVEQRIRTVRAAAETLRPARQPDPGVTRELREAQARLALLLDTNRASLPSHVPPPDHRRTERLIAEAKRLAERGDVDAALLVLAQAQSVEAKDPRVSFEIGELLFQAERYPDAIEAYRRTLRLDPSHARVFLSLGLAYREAGERHRAVYAFEQAILRSGDSSVLRRRAEWEVTKLTFGVVAEDGFAHAAQARDVRDAASASGVEFRVGAPRIAWWARLGARFVPYREKILVRWLDPSGALVQEAPAERYRKPYIGSTLEFDARGAQPPGEWTVEVWLEDDRLHRNLVRVLPAVPL